MNMYGNKTTTTPPLEVAVQLPESKVAAEGEPRRMVSAGDRRPLGKQGDAMQVALRMLCTVTSLVGLGFMVSAQQSSEVSVYGFLLPVQSKWSYSYSFQYLAGVCVAVAAQSLVQLVISMWWMLRQPPVIQSRTHAWLLLVVDQVLALAAISAGAAASGVSNLNKTGIRHTPLPNFCKPLNRFCDHVAVSIAFTFFSCLLLVISAFQEVYWLSKSKC